MFVYILFCIHGKDVADDELLQCVISSIRVYKVLDNAN